MSVRVSCVSRVRVGFALRVYVSACLLAVVMLARGGSCVCVSVHYQPISSSRGTVGNAALYSVLQL